MDLPEHYDDEDARKPVLAPMPGVRLLVHYDGTWGLVGDDGWEMDPETLREWFSDTQPSIAPTGLPPIDVEPIAMRDSEIR
ncbi:hypothetical protein AB0L82_32590 [Nocardia sp. NPDC052001]|uniref:hypothetical protein n=1 Tax=Nocardia sp. NPDC052001 TaxID=3154853 RepID=UPI0034266227